MHRVLVMNQGRVKVNAIVCSPVRHITLSNWAAIFHTDSQKGTQVENRLPSDFQCPLEDVSCVNTQQRRTYNFASNGFHTHFQIKFTSVCPTRRDSFVCLNSKWVSQSHLNGLIDGKGFPNITDSSVYLRILAMATWFASKRCRFASFSA